MIREAALKYHAAGHRVVPVGEDKRPLVAWKQYQTEQSREDVERIFEKEPFGVAILTGINGLEALDIDSKYWQGENLLAEYWELFKTYNPDWEPNFTLQKTPSGGCHILYRSGKVSGNQKLAQRYITDDEKEHDNDTVRVLFETRGIGGYVLAYPTPGYKIAKGSIENIEWIDKREDLLSVAKAYNEVLPEVGTVKGWDGVTPWDAYNAVYDYYHTVDLLTSHGWKVCKEDSKRVYLTRPGKDRGISGDIHKELNLFKSWTTSTEFEPQKGHTPYAVLSVLQYGSDFTKCARELYYQGFGDRSVTKEQEMQKEGLLDKVWASRWQFGAVEKPRWIFNYVSKKGELFNIASPGMIVTVVGKQKSRKTSFLDAITAAGLSGDTRLGFSLQAEGPIVHFDTEQGGHYFLEHNNRVAKMAGFSQCPEHYYSFPLREFKKKERVEAVNDIVREIRPSILVLDGTVDLCLNFNEIEPSEETVQFLMTLSKDTGALIFNVLHTTKGQGFLRGHLGSFLEQKSDVVIEVQRDDEANSSRVLPRDMRERPFPEQWFRQDRDGIPVICDPPGRKWDI